MRFFKSFSLLHRRSKSDTALAFQTPAHDTAVLMISASSKAVANISISAGGPYDLQPIRCSTSFNHRMFELGLENQFLSQQNTSLALRVAAMETQLRLTKSELYAQMHKNVHLHRQAKKDNDTILGLQTTYDVLQGFLQAFPDAALDFKNFTSDHTRVEIAAESTKMQPFVSSRPAENTRSRQSDGSQYASALQIILKTRQELRSCKKIAVFWRRKAKLSPEHKDLVTPSPSEISEVQNILTPEREEAVAVLQRRRQLMTASQSRLPLVHSGSFEQPSTTVTVVTCTQTLDPRERLAFDSAGSFGMEERVTMETTSCRQMAPRPNPDSTSESW